MPIPTFVAAGAFLGTAGSGSPGLPTGIQADDILLLFVETENEAVSLSDAQGFAQVNTPVGTGTAGATTASRITLFWKRATGSDAAPTIADAGDHIAARILAFRGCKTSGDPWNGTPTWTVDSVADTTIAADGPTTTVADCLVVIGAANVIDTPSAQTVSYSNAALANLGGTGVGDNTNQGTGGGFNVGTGEKASAGAVGQTTVTWGNATQKSVVVIALEGVAGQNHQRTPADVLSISDAVSSVQSHAQSIGDVLALASSPTTIQSHVRAISDVETLLDTLLNKYGEIYDYFDRSVTDGWGTSNSGHAWTIMTGAADFDVGSGVGTISVAVSTTRTAMIGASTLTQGEAIIMFSTSELPASGNLEVHIQFRRVDANNWYRVIGRYQGAATAMQLLAQKNVASTTSTLGTVLTTDITESAIPMLMRVRFEDEGTGIRIKAKLWKLGDPEPGYDDANKAIDRTDDPDAHTSGGQLAITAFNGAGNNTTTISIESFHFDEIGAAQMHTRQPADVETLADVMSPIKSYARPQADVETLADVMARVQSHGRNAADVLTLLDSTASIKAYVRSFNDIDALSDTMAQALMKPVLLGDVEGLADTEAHLIKKTVAIADVEVLADGTIIVQTHARTPADVETLGDSVSVVQSHFRATNDLLTLADVLSRRMDMARSAADIETLSDAMSYQETAGGQHVRNINDVLTLSDALTTVQSYVRSFGDIEGLADALAFKVDHTRSATDRIDLTDNATYRKIIAATLTDVETLSDTTATIKALARPISDVLTLDDLVSVRFDAARNIADVLALDDNAATALVYSRAFADVLTLSDAWIVGRVVSYMLQDQELLADLISFVHTPGFGEVQVLRFNVILQRTFLTYIKRHIATDVERHHTGARG